MIGNTLGHYQITSLIGKGGMREVYQAKDRKLDGPRFIDSRGGYHNG